MFNILKYKRREKNSNSMNINEQNKINQLYTKNSYISNNVDCIQTDRSKLENNTIHQSSKADSALNNYEHNQSNQYPEMNSVEDSGIEMFNLMFGFVPSNIDRNDETRKEQISVNISKDNLSCSDQIKKYSKQHNDISNSINDEAEIIIEYKDDSESTMDKSMCYNEITNDQDITIISESYVPSPKTIAKINKQCAKSRKYNDNDWITTMNNLFNRMGNDSNQTNLNSEITTNDKYHYSFKSHGRKISFNKLEPLPRRPLGDHKRRAPTIINGRKLAQKSKNTSEHLFNSVKAANVVAKSQKSGLISNRKENIADSMILEMKMKLHNNSDKNQPCSKKSTNTVSDKTKDIVSGQSIPDLRTSGKSRMDLKAPGKYIQDSHKNDLKQDNSKKLSMQSYRNYNPNNIIFDNNSVFHGNQITKPKLIANNINSERDIPKELSQKSYNGDNDVIANNEDNDVITDNVADVITNGDNDIITDDVTDVIANDVADVITNNGDNDVITDNVTDNTNSLNEIPIGFTDAASKLELLGNSDEPKIPLDEDKKIEQYKNIKKCKKSGLFGGKKSIGCKKQKDFGFSKGFGFFKFKWPKSKNISNHVPRSVKFTTNNNKVKRENNDVNIEHTINNTNIENSEQIYVNNIEKHVHKVNSFEPSNNEKNIEISSSLSGLSSSSSLSNSDVPNLRYSAMVNEIDQLMETSFSDIKINENSYVDTNDYSKIMDNDMKISSTDTKYNDLIENRNETKTIHENKIIRNDPNIIPDDIKFKVWRKFSSGSMDSYCTICETKISIENWYCARIIDGSNMIENLRPVCGVCNDNIKADIYNNILRTGDNRNNAKILGEGVAKIITEINQQVSEKVIILQTLINNKHISSKEAINIKNIFRVGTLEDKLRLITSIQQYKTTIDNTNN